MDSKVVIDAQALQVGFLATLVERAELSDNDVLSIKTTAMELNISVMSAASRLALVSEEDSSSIMAKLLQCELIDRVAICPSAVSVIEATDKTHLNLDWCINQQLFLSLDDQQQLAQYVVDPTNTFALSVIQSLTQTPVNTCVMTPAMCASLTDELIRERAVSELFGLSAGNASALAEEAPVINLVNSFLEKAVKLDASDIHIEAGANSMAVRFRVDGTLHEYMQQPMSRFSAISSRIKLLSELDIAERRLPQDGRFSTRQAGREFDIRVSTAPDVHGESIVMRLLPKHREELSLQKLGFEDDHLALIQKWGRLSNGIVLVTGPTGSGKSTTLYGLLENIKTGTEKIVTVEDPVEFQLNGITQVQARPDIGYTFAKALRTFLRQDPDVIMVGEIRDKETAEIAVQSSLTGHLVLSTLHTNDACSVFPRLSDIGVEPFLIAATIQGVQAQRLVRKLCQHCCEEHEAPNFVNMDFKYNTWRKPKGCAKCNGSGYRGRLGIYELIEVTPQLRELITKGAELSSLKRQAKLDGARTLLEDGLLKASQGVTSVDEVLRVCNSEDSN